MSDRLAALSDALRDRYRIERQIGAGGMATVYLARDLKHERWVALKVLKAELATAIGAQRFLAEIRTTANLHHPHILPLYDSGEADGTVFYVMPFVEGESLRDRLRRQQQLPIDDALTIAAEVADALQYAHERGVVHRDIKPENILLQGGHALVADFGVALSPDTLSGPRITGTGISVGTPLYMSPEQATADPNVDARTDVYALGCVLFEMFTGDPPFMATNIQSLVAKLLTEPPPGVVNQRERVPLHVEAAIHRALEKRPADRFASAKAFADALKDGNARASVRTSGPSASGGPVAASAPAPVAQPDVTRRSAPASRMPLVAAAVLAIALVGGGVWYATRDRVATNVADLTDQAPSRQITVLLGGVENRTGDSTFDALLAELLATTLEQSRTVAVFPRANMPFVLRRMQRAPDSPVDDSTAREIAVREGLNAVVTQSITRLGDAFVLVVSATRPDGSPVESATETIANVSDLPAAMDRIGGKLRSAFGESAAELAKASTPLDQVTSRSLDAVRFYSQGRAKLYNGDPRGAITLLKRAAELDPEFASAQGALGVAYTNVQDMASAAEHLRLAAKVADRAPEVEREKILGDFAMTRRDFNAACPHFELLTTMRPRDVSANLSLGWCSAQKLDFTTAVRATERAYELVNSPRTQINRAMVAFMSGDIDRGRENAKAVRAQAPQLMQAWFVEGKTYLARREFAEARALYEEMVDKGGDLEIEGHQGLADLALSTGRFDEARRHYEAAQSTATARGNISIATAAATGAAELALEQGARDRFAAMMTKVGLPQDPWLIYRVGRAWARGGRSDNARNAIAAIDSLSIGPSPQHDALRALLRAEIALARGDSALAVSEAESAVRFEASTVAHETAARAYLAAGRPADAARAYAELVKRPHERCESYDGPGCFRAVDALYWTGRLRAEAGDAAGATPLLEQFVKAWDGAPPHPWLSDAAARLKALSAR